MHGGGSGPGELWGMQHAAVAASSLQHLLSPAPPPLKLTACPPRSWGTFCFQAVFSVIQNLCDSYPVSEGQSKNLPFSALCLL